MWFNTKNIGFAKWSLEKNSITGGEKWGHVKHVSEVMLPGHLDCLFLQVSKSFGLRNVPDVPQRNSKKVLIKFVSKLETKSIHTSDLMKILKWKVHFCSNTCTKLQAIIQILYPIMANTVWAPWTTGRNSLSVQSPAASIWRTADQDLIFRNL